jgi:hypothetical protein
MGLRGGIFDYESAALVRCIALAFMCVWVRSLKVAYMYYYSGLGFTARNMISIPTRISRESFTCVCSLETICTCVIGIHTKPPEWMSSLACTLRKLPCTTATTKIVMDYGLSIDGPVQKDAQNVVIRSLTSSFQKTLEKNIACEGRPIKIREHFHTKKAAPHRHHREISYTANTRLTTQIRRRLAIS